MAALQLLRYGGNLSLLQSYYEFIPCGFITRQMNYHDPEILVKNKVSSSSFDTTHLNKWTSLDTMRNQALL